MSDEKVKLKKDLDFPGNSLGQGPREIIHDGDGRLKKDVKSVVTSNVIKKKKTLGAQLADTFIEEDRKSVGNYILFEVLIPAAKDTLANVVKGAIDMFLYGGIQQRQGPFSQNSQSKPIVSYNSYYNQKPQPRSYTNSGYDLGQIIVADRYEAELVISQMCDLLQQYGVVSVGDLLDLIGKTGQFTDQDWGWENLSTASIRRVREGYLLMLPPIKSLR